MGRARHLTTTGESAIIERLEFTRLCECSWTDRQTDALLIPIGETGLLPDQTIQTPQTHYTTNKEIMLINDLHQNVLCMFVHTMSSVGVTMSERLSCSVSSTMEPVDLGCHP